MTDKSFLCPDSWTRAHYERCSESLNRLSSAEPTHLIRALDDYRHALSKAHHGNEFLDIDLADVMLAGLRVAWAGVDDLAPLQRQWLTLATAYLVDPDDHANDFTDLSGLDDDAFIVATTLRAIGFDDHAQKIDEALG